MLVFAAGVMVSLGGYGRIAGALIVWRFFHDSPESKGFPPVNVPKEKKTMMLPKRQILIKLNGRF